MCLCPWYHFLLVFSADWLSITYPGKMFCPFSVLLFLNDIWHLTSGIYVCCINGSEPDLICCFHQTICHPLKLGHAVLLICDVNALGRNLEVKYSIHDEEHLCQILKTTKISCGTDCRNEVIPNSEDQSKSLVVISREAGAPTQYWHTSEVTPQVTEYRALSRMQKTLSRPGVFPENNQRLLGTDLNTKGATNSYSSDLWGWAKGGNFKNL